MTRSQAGSRTARACIECGVCRNGCARDLPIIETVKASLAKARADLAAGGRR